VLLTKSDPTVVSVISQGEETGNNMVPPWDRYIGSGPSMEMGSPLLIRKFIWGIKYRHPQRGGKGEDVYSARYIERLI